jgi:TonB family protein
VSDAETQVGFRSLGRSNAAGLAITVLIHGALAYVVYQSQIKSPPRPEATRDVIITRTISFKKPREKPWLPRIVTPPVPQAPPPEIKLTQNPEAPPAPPPEPKPAPKPEDKNVNKDLKRALERARALANAAKEEPEEGPVSGFGDATENVTGDAYATEVYNAIRRNWNAPAGLLNEAQLAALTTEIRVTVEKDGSLKRPMLVKPSGNDLFDDSCLQAVKATGRVPPPPANVWAQYRRGFVLAFEGKELAR